MNTHLISISTLIAISILTGCASKHKPKSAETAPPIVVSPTMVEIAHTQQQRVPSGQRTHLHSQSPIPVWQSARVQRVYMAGHVNEHNEGYYRSEKDVIVESGKWNLDALNNPTLSYIPEANTVPVPTQPGRNYTHMVSPGSIAPQPIQQMEQSGQTALLEGVDDVQVMGLMELSQEYQARAQETEESIAVFYESLGWCLVPREHLLPVKGLPNG